MNFIDDEQQSSMSKYPQFVIPWLNSSEGSESQMPLLIPESRWGASRRFEDHKWCCQSVPSRCYPQNWWNTSIPIEGNYPKYCGGIDQNVEAGEINELRAKIEYSEKKNNLEALSEAELVETYNRQENLRIFGLPKETTQNIDGKTLSESYDQTISKVVTLTSERGAAACKNEISIDHRFPSKCNGHRPLIVHSPVGSQKPSSLERRKLWGRTNSLSEAVCAKI